MCFTQRESKMMKKSRGSHLWLLIITIPFIISLGGEPLYAGKAGKNKKIKKVSVDKRWSIGPTGILGRPDKHSVKVTGALPGSPADGKVKAGDEIIAVDGKPVSNYMAYKAFAESYDRAEGGEKMVLTLKDGKKVELSLVKIGRYSPTAPYDCPKTDAIVSNIAGEILKNKGFMGGTTKSGALGLLATGEEKYTKPVLDSIKTGLIDGKYPKGEILKGKSKTSWTWGYASILLSEYYLLTKDENALPAIRSYSMSLAKGQDSAGLWGHAMSRPHNNRAPGYGQMNQPSLSCFIALILAKKCGIEEASLNEAIEKSRRYFKAHAWVGGFPYGFHGPIATEYNNNGTSGSAAIAFSLLGDTDATKFFSQSAAASHESLTSGHASSFFNPLWTPLGAALSGPEVTKQFYKKSLWLIDTHRTWDREVDAAPGKEGTIYGYNLLIRCLPRKALILTGREADQSIWVKGAKAATEVVERKGVVARANTNDELFDLLKSPFPQVRSEATTKLGKAKSIEKTLKRESMRNKKSKKALKPHKLAYPAKDEDIKRIYNRMREFLKPNMASEDELFAATNYFRSEGIKKYPEVEADFIVILNNKKLLNKIRASAASFLAFSQNTDLYQDFLSVLLEEKADDFLGYIDISLTNTMNTMRNEFIKNKSSNWKAVFIKDKEKYYKGANKMLNHKLQIGRGAGVQMLKDITLDDFHHIADALDHVLKDEDTTYHSYHNPGTALGPGISIYARLNIKEGLEHLESNISSNTGKWGFKRETLFKTIPKYGANGKEVLDRLMKTDPRLSRKRLEAEHGPTLKSIEDNIASDKDPIPLITLPQAKAAGAK